jgi:hypothetical protein
LISSRPEVPSESSRGSPNQGIGRCAATVWR